MPEVLSHAFRSAFSDDRIEEMADSLSWELGQTLAIGGHVGKLTVTKSSVRATVQGASSHQVKLWLDHDEPAFECSCPIGQKGRFCKHAVAVALVATVETPDTSQQDDVVVDVRNYLESLEHQALVELLMERVANDEMFDAQLQMTAARTSGAAVQIGVFQQVIDDAFAVDDYVSYREMYTYAARIDDALDTLQGLLDDGHAAAVLFLTGYAMELAEDVLGYVDDSDGYMSVIAERLQDLHLAACTAARPDPVALAHDLFSRELHAGDLGFFFGAARRYAQVLGPGGLAEYRRLAQVEWDAVPPIGPDDSVDRQSSQRYRITGIMQSLAEASGDVDALVEVLAHDQSSAYQFVRIAEVLREAERYDDALEWAQRGLTEHGGLDSRLVDIAAEEYGRAGRSQEAVQLTWDAYERSPCLATYQQLAKHAKQARAWDDWHDKALELLRARGEQAERNAPKRTSTWAAPRPDSSTLVEVLLYDADVEAAWAEAKAHGCRNSLWLTLAERRQTDHPLEVIPIWQDEIERRIGLKKNQAYADAVDLITRVCGLMRSADQEAKFSAYVAGLRMKHKAKRNLMKLFDQRNW